MSKNTTIDYNGQEYAIFIEGMDALGAGSIKDLADDLAFDIAADLKLRYGTDAFNKTTYIIRKALHEFIRASILPRLIDPAQNEPMLFPPKHKETEIWQVN